MKRTQRKVIGLVDGSPSDASPMDDLPVQDSEVDASAEAPQPTEAPPPTEASPPGGASPEDPSPPEAASEAASKLSAVERRELAEKALRDMERRGHMASSSIAKRFNSYRSRVARLRKTTLISPDWAFVSGRKLLGDILEEEARRLGSDEVSSWSEALKVLSNARIIESDWYSVGKSLMAISEEAIHSPVKRSESDVAEWVNLVEQFVDHLERRLNIRRI